LKLAAVGTAREFLWAFESALAIGGGVWTRAGMLEGGSGRGVGAAGAAQEPLGEAFGEGRAHECRLRTARVGELDLHAGLGSAEESEGGDRLGSKVCWVRVARPHCGQRSRSGVESGDLVRACAGGDAAIEIGNVARRASSACAFTEPIKP